MMIKRKILLIGHSHILCILDAFSNTFKNVIDLDYLCLHKDKMNGNEDNFPVYLSHAVNDLRVAGDGRSYALVVACLGGNAHNTLGLIKMNPPFDFVLSSREFLEIEAGAFLVPERIVRDVIKFRCVPSFIGLAAIKALLGEQVVCIESPPPIGDDEHVKEYLEKHFIKFFPENRQIVTATLRYKLWRAASEIYSEHCLKLEIPYVNCPESAMIDGMYLARSGYPKNVTHGNRWYGERVLENIIEKFLDKHT
ncbi:hypothetical protein [Thiocystis violacea]|uniref:hypothetical protein n=1 Tax=Thiocystis violacea TaxID=13725 RepID=UPI001A92DE7A|nr:hypothetical protein [Thiocystis violacea]